MSDRTCTFPECSKPAWYGTGLCNSHYSQQQRGEELRPLRVYPPAVERFWPKVDDAGGPDSCWPWLGAISKTGYGTFSVNQSSFRAHRFAYEICIGPIPAGLMVDHMCHNLSRTCEGGTSCAHRACVNPRHLELATARENTLRSPLTTAGRHARKTHCIHGHEFTPENTYAGRNGSRRCATCCAIRYQASKKTA